MAVELYDQDEDPRAEIASPEQRIRRMQHVMVDCIVELGVLARQMQTLDLDDFRWWEAE